MLSINQYVYYKLSGCTELTGITSFHALTAIDANKPYIVYKRTGENPEYNRNGLSRNTTAVRIDVMCSNYDESLLYAEKIRTLFEKQTGKYKDIIVYDCFMSTPDEQTDGQVWVQTLNFEFVTN